MLGAPMFQSSTPMQPATPAVVRRVACHQCGWLGTLDVTATAAAHVGVEPGRSLPENCWGQSGLDLARNLLPTLDHPGRFILPRRMSSHARHTGLTFGAVVNSAGCTRTARCGAASFTTCVAATEQRRVQPRHPRNIACQAAIGWAAGKAWSSA